jgi:hypothetical protein
MHDGDSDGLQTQDTWDNMVYLASGLQKRNPTCFLLLVLLMRLQVPIFDDLVKLGFVLRMAGVSRLVVFARRLLPALYRRPGDEAAPRQCPP